MLFPISKPRLEFFSKSLPFSGLQLSYLRNETESLGFFYSHGYDLRSESLVSLIKQCEHLEVRDAKLFFKAFPFYNTYSRGSIAVEYGKKRRIFSSYLLLSRKKKIPLLVENH